MALYYSGKLPECYGRHNNRLCLGLGSGVGVGKSSAGIRLVEGHYRWSKL